MVQMTVRLTAASGRAHQLVQALDSLMRHTLEQRGCRDAHLAADVGEADAFWYCEEWDDAQALEDDIRSERFTQLLVLLETSVSPPTLEFRVFGETRGLDYVSAVRAAAESAEP